MFIFIYLLCFVVFLVYVYFKQCFSYWEQRGVLAYPNPSLPFGHYLNPYQKAATNLGVMMQQFYTYFREKGQKHGGIYMMNAPIYIPVDLDIIKDITIKHFDHFDSKGLFYNEAVQPCTAHMFQIGGSRWKKLRVKLSPTFTSGKMKMMFPLVLKCTQPLIESLKDDKLEAKNTCGRFTTDVIGSCAFGIECDSFENTAFHHYCKLLFETDSRRAVSRNIQMFQPRLAKFLRLVSFPRICEEFFVNFISDTVKLREESQVTRNDFMQLLIALKNAPNPSEAISMKEVISEGFLFFAAGFETSSSAMSFCLYELAKHADIQELVRKESRMVFEKYGGELTYESLSELKYMQQVIDETLRLYPPISILNRECTKDITIHNVHIEKGTKVFIPAYAIQRDSTYFENPDRFNPDRFSETEKSRPFAHLAFGEGPRICIGMRFAYMQMKIGLAHLLRMHKFTLDPSMTRQLTFNKAFTLYSNEEILLNYETMTNCDE